MSNVNKIGIFISIVLLLNNLARDWDLEQQNVGDLRNRIVGARMQKDGLSPYFHKWKNGDGVRYYDPLNENNLKVSTCTASPFFHTLLYPLAELSYDVTCKIWIMILYVLLVLMMIMAIVLSANRNVLLICFIGVGYTFSETWLDTVVTKQMYLFIPFFAMLVYLFLVKGDNKPFLYILAGIFLFAWCSQNLPRCCFFYL